MPKPDLDVMRRVLHRHQWSDIADWISALDELAILSDEEIERLVRPSSPSPSGKQGTGAKKQRVRR